MSKKEDLEYIKKFSKIGISKACKNINVNRGNVLNGTASENTIKKVRTELENQLATIYFTEIINKKVEELKKEE